MNNKGSSLYVFSIRGFTLLEILVALSLTICLLLFLGRVFMGTDHFLSQHRSHLQKTKSIHQIFSQMREEISLAPVRSDSHRYLNLFAHEDNSGVYLYFCRVNDQSLQANNTHFIQYICYLWDKASSNIYRAIYLHPETFTNPNRLEKNSLSYQSPSNPYEWINSSAMQNALQQARTQPPLVTDVKSFSVEFFHADESSQINTWNNPSILPKKMSVKIRLKNNQFFNTLIFCRYYGVISNFEY
ncbi:MAG: PulJ/GspJ family protein [Verrucomicrobiota bacterium]